MNVRTFLIQLALVSAASAGLVFWMNSWPRFASHAVVGWASLGVFVLISLGMYYAGRKAAVSENKHDFTNVALGVTVGKLFFAIGFILGYNYLAQPDDRQFIIPFFSVYLIYTIFETYVMMKLGQTDQNK
ncbi:hypothetical protein [Phaeodactylibacter luteus]|uniref:Uncharacterized protein n=1 Tax=Phaeodactylibacter luteus TaxID=1564516 RepID=A0A5C6RLA5_9BACT|nr:hypothetical protein [Phaeodactylibacter luteus]TXB63033.1 hypothetical protein FRY97_11045 [Phaeodactylibacter luteus]